MTKVLKIILIDDDPFISAVYAKKFEKRGYKVFVFSATDPNFLSVIHEIKPDLIVSDIIRPGINGLEFFNLIKSDNETKNIPFVFLSNTLSLVLDVPVNEIVLKIDKAEHTPEEVATQIFSFVG